MKGFRDKKNISLTQAVALVRKHQKAGRIVGCLSGSYDVMTAVHFLALEERSKKCDVLILLLNSDASIRAYKGKAKPILSQFERSYCVAQSPFVEAIVLFDEVTPVHVLSELKPDVYLNSSEWGSECVEKTAVEEYGGKVVVFDFEIPEKWCSSTSELINRITVSEAQQVGKAIFLDRDGVINENKSGYIYRWEDFTFKPHVFSALRAFMKSGYKLVIVTNQSGIARGYYTDKDVQKLHKKMCEYLKTKKINIDRVYYCPHGSNEKCDCRKPGTKMFFQAALELNLNLSKSWFIGDSVSDVEAGRYANIKTIFIGEEKKYPPGNSKPHYFVSDMNTAKSKIIM